MSYYIKVANDSLQFSLMNINLQECIFNKKKEEVTFLKTSVLQRFFHLQYGQRRGMHCMVWPVNDNPSCDVVELLRVLQKTGGGGTIFFGMVNYYIIYAWYMVFMLNPNYFRCSQHI